MQPILNFDEPIRYAWEPIPVPGGMSLKNSCHFKFAGQEYIFASDMMRGGTVLLWWTGSIWLERAHWFPGAWYQWNPYPVMLPNGGVEVFVCDALPGYEESHWWDYMRIFSFFVDPVTGGYGPMGLVSVQEESSGLIDPCLIQIGTKWYLFFAKLWDAADGQWWDPHYAVADNPFGPFVGDYHLGITDHPGVLGIDEAVKVVVTKDRELLYTASHGDSGINGFASMGFLEVTGQHNGVLTFVANERMLLKATDSELCTALDVSAWPDVYATCRRPGYTGNRDEFEIRKLK